MHRYKRNQLEEAIDATLREGRADVAADIRVRVKRLLETDRALARDDATAAFAFYTGKAPGSGAEVWFSSYETFAILLALLLLRHRWPQGTAVRIMRQARPVLEPEHAHLLTRDPAILFDEAELAKRATPGAMALSSTDPIFLAIVSTGRDEGDRDDLAPHAVKVCRGENELMTFMRQRASVGLTSMTALEVTQLAHLLADHLNQTSPRNRGRKGL